MNNQQLNNGDQFVRLQNIAYIKQFLRKGSIKVMMVVSFISAFLTGYMFLSIGSILDSIKEFAYMSNSSMNIDELNALISIFSSFFAVIGIIAIVINLILPVTLLVIIIRAHNDDPTVVPSGAITFLYILSIIGFVFMIISCVLSIVSTIIAIVNTNSLSQASDSSGGVVGGNIFSYVFSCLYWFFQFKFLGSVKNSSKGNALVSAGAQGFGVYSIIYAILCGICTVICLVFFVIMMSFSSSPNQMLPDEFGQLISSGLISSMLTYFVIATIILVLSTIYQIAAASTAFGYKNTVTEAIRASYTAPSNNPYNRANGTINSPFRTYGGDSAYKNYNYSNSGYGGQQGYANQQGRNDSANTSDNVEQNTDNLMYK